MTHLPRTVRERANSRWTPEEDDLLRARHTDGRTVPQLARLHGREPMAILTRLRELRLIADRRVA